MKHHKITYATDPASEIILDRAYKFYGKYFKDLPRQEFCTYLDDRLKGCRWEGVCDQVYYELTRLRQERDKCTNTEQS